ncbi:MAG: signal peptidase I [Clostridia bacterium]|nr:signal peptidase I [Clostridia bacterium]
MSYRGKRRLYNILSGITVFLIVMISFLLAISLIFNIVYIKTYVRGYSMLPTLNSTVELSTEDGDTVFINKYSKFTNNDIVVAKVNWWSEGSIIKRLIGMPGDQIEIRDLGNEYGLYVNDSLMYTRYKNDSTLAHYLEYINLIDEETFTGTTKFGNKCIKLTDDQYFLMGDNWGGSVDCLRYGPISSDNIVGRVEIIIPHNEDNSFLIIFKYMMKGLFAR